MAIDPARIELTHEQKKRVAELSERTGSSYSDLLDEWLSGVLVTGEHGESDSLRPRPKNLYEAFQAVGAIGCFSGPPDLSTNPKYMEGFGTNAKRSDAD